MRIVSASSPGTRATVGIAEKTYINDLDIAPGVQRAAPRRRTEGVAVPKVGVVPRQAAVVLGDLRRVLVDVAEVESRGVARSRRRQGGDPDGEHRVVLHVVAERGRLAENLQVNVPSVSGEQPVVGQGVQARARRAQIARARGLPGVLFLREESRRASGDQETEEAHSGNGHYDTRELNLG